MPYSCSATLTEWRGPLRLWRAFARFAAVSFCSGLVLLPGRGKAACASTSAGFYTAAQAAAGKVLFDQECASCHNTDLSGGAGPPLAGQPFAAWLQFTKLSGAQLFDFITTQMPYNAPGSLTEAQYQDAFAHILAVNRYPAGTTPLDAKSVACVELLPYPK